MASLEEERLPTMLEKMFLLVIQSSQICLQVLCRFSMMSTFWSEIKAYDHVLCYKLSTLPSITSVRTSP
ncbi:hypothetical protein PVAP13_8NG079419 [Panicum virgatum]|uniref:Uncharacterized protein n=1 Tax=Panicum virgatum TaxID=38727 RepID=A0A8T0PB38_PANVG|nr:hypothetical protein PVAP13_8NG079419 [Panicum virgatum]